MNLFLRALVTLAMIFSGIAFANPPPAAKPITVQDTVNGLRGVQNFGNFLALVSSLDPKFNKKEWIDFAKKHNLDLNEIQYTDVSVSGNEVTFPGVKTPFIYMNDHKTVSFNGVKVVLDPKLPLETNMARIQKAWGGFKEFKTPAKATSRLDFLIPRAKADLVMKALEVEMALSAGILGIIVAGAIYAGEGAILLTALGTLGVYVAGGAALAAVCYGAAIIWDRLAKTKNLIGVELACDQNPPALVDSDDHKRAKLASFDSGFDHDGLWLINETMADICAAGPKAQKQFNKSLALTKSMVADGTIKFKLKPNSPDSMGGAVQ